LEKQKKQMEHKTDIESKRRKEKNVVKLMIGLYCKGHKHLKDDFVMSVKSYWNILVNE